MTPSGSGNDAGRMPIALSLPRAALDALLRAALARQSQAGGLLLLAHAPLVLQPGPLGSTALVGAFNMQDLRALPAREPAGLVPLSPDGLTLVAVAAQGVEPPQDEAAWETWLIDHAAAFRLATSARNPCLAVLWLRPDGQGALMFRRGQLPNGKGTVAISSRWVPLPQLLLPGGGMQHVDFTGNAVSATGGLSDPEPYEQGSRFGQQAVAHGAAALQFLQGRHIVLVGAGRVGSVLAHGLVRLGVRRLSVIDPDHMEPHNEDGDLAPLLEGRPKVEALQRFLRGLLRPGAELDLQAWPASNAGAGRLVAQSDAVVACVDNDAARLWANAWALAHNRCLLAVATRVQTAGAEADLRLLPAGSGCLACVGGHAQADQLLQQLALDGAVATPADFRQQRQGSLRSWSALAAHLGQRMLEQHLLRPGGGALFRQLLETPEGGMQVRDWRPAEDEPRRTCPFCRVLQGAGAAAVTAPRLRALTAAWLKQASVSSARFD